MTLSMQRTVSWDNEVRAKLVVNDRPDKRKQVNVYHKRTLIGRVIQNPAGSIGKRSWSETWMPQCFCIGHVWTLKNVPTHGKAERDVRAFWWENHGRQDIAAVAQALGDES